MGSHKQYPCAPKNEFDYLIPAKKRHHVLKSHSKLPAEDHMCRLLSTWCVQAATCSHAASSQMLSAYLPSHSTRHEWCTLGKDGAVNATTSRKVCCGMRLTARNARRHDSWSCMLHNSQGSEVPLANPLRPCCLLVLGWYCQEHALQHIA